MVTNLFHSFEDELLQYTHDDFHSSLGSCDAYPFVNLDFFYEYLQPPSFSNYDGH
jgi:hypothetical protein